MSQIVPVEGHRVGGEIDGLLGSRRWSPYTHSSRELRGKNVSNSAASGEGLTRREALKRGAVIAGAVWAVPVMQVVNMSAAHASSGGSNGQVSPTSVGGLPSPPSGPSGDKSGQWGRDS